ncbi:hypothetical protein [Curtobacterium sp. NPDC089689]|uniref:hypothetical protein n=1 Tax=Curtobacterium sp. NPDC089689 TaxID=3363968 RepID=UPI00382DE1D6
MDITRERVTALIGPLRAIAMDQPDKQRLTRAQLEALTADVAATGRQDWIAIVDAANQAPDGHADEPLEALIRHLS